MSQTYYFVVFLHPTKFFQFTVSLVSTCILKINQNLVLLVCILFSKSPRERIMRGGHHPPLQPKKNKCMSHHLEKYPQHLHVSPFPFEYILQPSPLCPWHPEFFHHCRPIIAQGYQDSYKVIEIWHQVKCVAICLEILFNAHPHLLLCHPVLLPLRPHGALGGDGAAAI